MTSDLILGAVILAALSLAVFAGVALASRRLPPWVCDGIAVLVIVLLGFYIRDVWDNIELARWLPYSNLIVLGNGFPLAMAVLAGVAWNRVPPPVTRKIFTTLLLFGASAYAVYFPFRGEVPVCRDLWEDGVCRQTTHDTCSAASAATLLRHHGIPATEQEMAELCITRKGTSWLGLFRGMKLKTARTDWDVEIISGSIEDLQRDSFEGAIVFLRLTAEVADQHPKYEASGWIAGTSHSAVLFEIRDDGMCQMGDPSVGRERLALSDLKQLYEGRGMRLVRVRR